MRYEPVIGLEVHAELATRTKMFCACPVVDPTCSRPNEAVCPVCSGLPGVLPVVNRQAVELALRVALALGCRVNRVSLFARKNYFYPDLPKGYQISQYEEPLAVEGRLPIETPTGWREIRIRRVHLEEDTGKLTHVRKDGEEYSLVDLNRAGVPLLEIVSEPDLHSAAEVRAYAQALRAVLRYVGASSGDMEKGALRIEPNISIRPEGSSSFGTRVEIKNLNSFRALERAVAYQIERQTQTLQAGLPVAQETVGWDEAAGVTFSQRSKEEAHDYRYFPEPDLPPLVVEEEWIASVHAALPELPWARLERLQRQYDLPVVDARLLVDDPAVADYFEATAAALRSAPARMAANWVTGELFAWLNQSGQSLGQIRVSPRGLAALLDLMAQGTVTLNTGKAVLAEMLQSGADASEIIRSRGLEQVSDAAWIADLVRETLRSNPAEVEKYLSGKETVANWFYGQVMRAARGRANPQVVQEELQRQLKALKR
ncbi:aspartyl/glutamyl-tRNA(Asn/Gln) amidotransferase subunit B [Anaerolinea thermolimosa]|uniref:Asp-tRNA(Asn)/Glu-tRNA(Gln) amidotransferase subunit GatB n=1 Tax=Anaerolinea thermolimosa TaxID=229919 RepID=UPI000784B642|nr:Asp-tRNA(Asn)/Glu-tRNA(Gln) amidotransferase subunit GatB [Anaerolinea thermolimosa]GAP08085.1 aspartyl/glutamyl-tRNA(Asn/Gln) amidotransferase subunit B [Anaerolinea thermolimosa]